MNQQYERVPVKVDESLTYNAIVKIPDSTRKEKLLTKWQIDLYDEVLDFEEIQALFDATGAEPDQFELSLSIDDHNLVAVWFDLETDKVYEKRMKRVAKDKEKQAKAKSDKEARERREYERLKAKYG